MTAELPPLVEELRDLLIEERGALLSGRPERITELALRKLVLAEQIEAIWGAADLSVGSAAAAAIAALDRYNRENSIICAAMLRHLRGALDVLRRHELHRSYTSDGSERSPTASQALGAA